MTFVTIGKRPSTELLKVLPLVCDSYSASAVCLVTVVDRIVAPIPHVIPNASHTVELAWHESNPSEQMSLQHTAYHEGGQKSTGNKSQRESTRWERAG